jgi:hypothetical protein
MNGKVWKVECCGKSESIIDSAGSRLGSETIVGQGVSQQRRETREKKKDKTLFRRSKVQYFER